MAKRRHPDLAVIVTADHIKKGIVGNNNHCALANAGNASFGIDNMHVDVDYNTSDDAIPYAVWEITENTTGRVRIHEAIIEPRGLALQAILLNDKAKVKALLRKWGAERVLKFTEHYSRYKQSPGRPSGGGNGSPPRPGRGGDIKPRKPRRMGARFS